MFGKSKDKTKLSTPKDNDFDDLDDLGDDLDGLDIDGIDGLDGDREATNPSKARVAAKLGKEAADGAFSSALRNTAKKTLPDEYSSNYYEAMDLANYTKEVVDRNKQALNKSTYKLGKEVKKVLPFKIGMLDKYLENQESNFETQKTESEDQMRDTAVKGELTGIFDKQLEVQKFIEAKRDAQADVDKKEQLIQNQMSQDVLTSIDSNVAQQAAFTVQISKEYYRKSLELQYKSFYVQSDILRLSKEYFKGFAAQFTNIEKNTSLPDFVKLKTSEKLRDIMREQTVQSVYKQVYSNSKYLDSVKKRVGGLFDEKIQSVTDLSDSLADMLDNMSSSSEAGGGSAAGMLAGVGASMAGDTIGEKVSTKWIPKIKDKIKDNKAVKTGANYMGMLGNSASSLLEHVKAKNAKMVDNNSAEGGPTEWMKSKIGGLLSEVLNVATPGAENFDVKGQGYLGHSKPAIFDNKVYRSITDVIPMYLAAILKESSDLKGMYQTMHPEAIVDNPILRYDFKTRTLDTKGKIETKIMNDLFKNKSMANKSKNIATSMLTETSRVVGNDVALSDKQKKEKKNELGNKNTSKILAKYIEEASKDRSQDLSYEKMILSYEDNEELKKIVESQGEDLKKVINKMRDHKVENTSSLDNKIKDLKNPYPIATLKQAVKLISRISGSNIPHLLSDETATSFAKAFSAYFMKSGKAVISDSVINTKAFMYMKKEDVTDDVKQSISILISDCSRINALDDFMLSSSMDALFGEVDASLRSAIDCNPDVFKEMAEMYPDIVGEGNLTPENLVEGKLRTSNEDTQYMETGELLGLGKVKASELKAVRSAQNSLNVVDHAFINTWHKSKEVFKTIVDNKNDPSFVLKYLKEEMIKAKTSVAAKLETNLGELKKLLGEKMGLDGITDGGSITKTILSKAVAATDQAITKIDNQIALLDKDLQERTNNTESLIPAVEALGMTAAVTKEAGKITKMLDARKKNLVKVLTTVKVQLGKQRELLNSELTKMNETGVSTAGTAIDEAKEAVKTRVKTLRDHVKSTVDTLKASLEEYEQANATLEATPA